LIARDAVGQRTAGDTQRAAEGIAARIGIMRIGVIVASGGQQIGLSVSGTPVD
jgi:hypothetical protein